MIIDPFESGDFSFSTSTPGELPVATQSGLADVLGGERIVHLGLYHVGSMSGSLTTDAGNNAARFSYQTPTIQSTGTLDGVVVQYGSSIKPLGANLVASGHDRFQVTFSGAGRPVFASMRVDSAFVGLGPGSTDGIYEALFSSFSSTDLTAVTQMSFAFTVAPFGQEPTFNREFSISDIRVVPEPALSLIALAAVSFVSPLRRSRRR